MAKINKARFWTAVLYPENMLDDWEIKIGDIVQYPYAYCKHTQDKDSKSEHRKDHVHVILAFPNTTTYKHAMEVFDLLSKPSCKALNTCEAVIGIRNVYDYLIHDTEACRKQGKELYSPSDRVTGNNFDIGAYEQLGIVEKNAMFIELSEAIRQNGFTNYMDFYCYVVDTYEDMNYIEVMRSYSGHFERMTKGNFQKTDKNNTNLSSVTSYQHGNQHGNQHEINTENSIICCPDCGSIEVVKNGKTLANTPRFKCKACGKVFCKW